SPVCCLVRNGKAKQAKRFSFLTAQFLLKKSRIIAVRAAVQALMAFSAKRDEVVVRVITQSNIDDWAVFHSVSRCIEMDFNLS
ncbi:MAG: hypothetical protein WAL95_09095, partial [Candidatus Acidiferrales bacterium]